MLELLVGSLVLLVIANFLHIAFSLGKSYGYQKARNEDASILLGRPEVKNVESINEMSACLAQTILSEDALDKKTIYIVRPSDAHAVRKLLKERKSCEGDADKSEY